MAKLSEAKLIAFLATSRPDKSRRFYEDVLGLPFVGDEPFALVFDAGGTMLRISKLQEFTPPPYTVLGWEVSDIGAEVAELAAYGVRFQFYAALPQDESGIYTFDDGTRVAWFVDPDGNTLSLTQFLA